MKFGVMCLMVFLAIVVVVEIVNYDVTVNKAQHISANVAHDARLSK